jgi:hypothetical protein
MILMAAMSSNVVTAPIVNREGNAAPVPFTAEFSNHCTRIEAWEIKPCPGQV